MQNTWLLPRAHWDHKLHSSEPDKGRIQEEQAKPQKHHTANILGILWAALHSSSFDGTVTSFNHHPGINYLEFNSLCMYFPQTKIHGRNNGSTEILIVHIFWLLDIDTFHNFTLWFQTHHHHHETRNCWLTCKKVPPYYVNSLYN